MALESTRRGFLGGAAGAAALGGMMGGAAQAQAGAADIRLGIASYSLRQFQRPLAIKMIQKLGVKYVAIKEFHISYKLTPEELRRAAGEFTKAGLEIVGGSTIYMQKPDPEDVRQYFEYAKNCSMPLMTIGPSHESLPIVEKFVKEYNIKVAIHNHGPEDKHFPSPEVAMKAIQGMDPRVGLCIDVGHTSRTGTNPVESIRNAGARLLDIHIKDLKDLMNARSQVAVGEGAMPVVEIFKQLKKMNYGGYVNLEYEIDADDPLLGMAKSISYMRGVLAGLKS